MPLNSPEERKQCHLAINTLREKVTRTAGERSGFETERLIRLVVDAEDRIAKVFRSDRVGGGAVTAAQEFSGQQISVDPDGGTAENPAPRRSHAQVARAPHRVLLIARHWAGTGVGGSATVNRELAAAAARLGHEVFVRVGQPVTDWEPPRGVTLIGPREYEPNVPLHWQLDTDVEHLPEGIDTIIGHKAFTGWAARFIRNARYPDARLIHFLHTDDAAFAAMGLQGSMPYGRALKFQEGELVAGADVAVGVGPVLTELARELAGRARTPPGVHELIPGIEVSELLEQPPLEGEGRASVILMGRIFSARKGAHEAARIAGLAREYGGGIDLILAGAMPESAEQSRQILSDIAGQTVEVWPYVTDYQEKLAILRRAHMLIMPSRAESFGLVPLEALCLGLPVLVPDTSGFGRWIRRLFPEEIARRMLVRQDYTGPIPLESWAHRILEEACDVPGAWETAARARTILQAGGFTWDAAVGKLMSAGLD